MVSWTCHPQAGISQVSVSLLKLCALGSVRDGDSKRQRWKVMEEDIDVHLWSPQACVHSHTDENTPRTVTQTPLTTFFKVLTMSVGNP